MSEDAWQSDLIIWPETAVPMVYDKARPFLTAMSKLAEDNNTNIISGIPYRRVDKENSRYVFHNSIVSLGEGQNIYHKQKLVPFGEYVPLEDFLRGLIDFFNLPMSNFRTGSNDQELLKSFDYQAAPFICYEVVYPDFVAAQSSNADYLITISNDSWFGTSIGPLQHLEMAQMRAAENARYMVRGTNNGVSAIINERGQIKDQSEQFVQTTLLSEIQLLEGRTPFSYTGSKPILILCALLILLQQYRRKQNIKKA
jgi:apolipoprotein N-acyltransferase